LCNILILKIPAFPPGSFYLHFEEKSRPIVVFDEFQDLLLLDKSLDKRLRAVIQFHQHVNFVFLGSAESLMKQIFENKKSSFYHLNKK